MEAGPNTAYRRSGVFERSDDQEARHRAVRPLGEWNTVEIVSKNSEVRTYLNGTPISSRKRQFTEPGFISFQSQGTEIHWRNIRIKAE